MNPAHAIEGTKLIELLQQNGATYWSEFLSYLIMFLLSAAVVHLF